MGKQFIRILILWGSCGLFVGCVEKPIHHAVHATPPRISRAAYDLPQFNKTAVEIDPQLMHWSLYWRCTVGNQFNTWHSEASTLIDAQMKAKQLCELLSNGQGICRYKGCVQVESE